MIDPKTMTEFQKLVTGLRIIEQYLSPKDNPGEVELVEGVMTVIGVGPTDVSAEDRKTLEAIGWYAWEYSGKAWKFSP